MKFAPHRARCAGCGRLCRSRARAGGVSHEVGHPRRAVPARRRHGHRGALDRAEAVGEMGTAGRRRQQARRRRHDRRRARVARQARRLHDHDDQRAGRRGQSVAVQEDVRTTPRPRSCRSAWWPSCRSCCSSTRACADDDQGLHRAGQGQAGRAHVQQRRQRQLDAPRRVAVRERHRDQARARAVQGRRPAMQDLMGGVVEPDVPHGPRERQRGQERQGAGRSRSRAAHDRLRSPTSRRWRKAACRATSRSRGSASSRPPGTPKAIVDKISKDVQEIVAAPDMKERFIAQGATPVGSTAEQFKSLIDSETQRYRKIIVEKNISATE